MNDFHAELFDPEAWADLIVRSGAKYVVPTSKVLQKGKKKDAKLTLLELAS